MYREIFWDPVSPMLLRLILRLVKMLWRDLKVILLIHGVLHLRLVKMVFCLRHLFFIFLIFLFPILKVG